MPSLQMPHTSAKVGIMSSKYTGEALKEMEEELSPALLIRQIG